MDLTTTYLGKTLRSPVVAAASPLSKDVDSIKRLDDAGVGAVVMHSLFEEQIVAESRALDHYLSYGSDSFAEALSYFPEHSAYNVGPDAYLENIVKAKASVSVPVIGSLNGVSTGGWLDYARQIEQAGADALELNIYYIPTNPALDSREVEQMYLDVVSDVAREIQIPLAVKIGPFFTSLANMANRFAQCGARGLVLFNRFYQPDLDLETFEVTPHLVLSNSNELRLPLRWVAILYGRANLDFAISTGVHTHEDVLKGLFAGANITTMASALLLRGPKHVREIHEKMKAWMEAHEYESVKQLRGAMSQQHVAEPAAFERANYMKALQSWRPDPTGRLL